MGGTQHADFSKGFITIIMFTKIFGEDFGGVRGTAIPLSNQILGKREGFIYRGVHKMRIFIRKKNFRNVCKKSSRVFLAVYWLFLFVRWFSLVFLWFSQAILRKSRPWVKFTHFLSYCGAVRKHRKMHESNRKM